MISRKDVCNPEKHRERQKADIGAVTARQICRPAPVGPLPALIDESAAQE